jgi:hypothetical protein
MIAYLSDHNRPLEGVPSHLMERRLNELILSWYTTWKVRCLDVLETGVVYADISQATKQSVFAWLESVNAVCVDLEPQDIVALSSRHPIALAAADLLNVDPAVRQGCARLEIGEVISTVSELERLALAVSEKNMDERDATLNSYGNEPELRANIQYQYDLQDRAGLERLKQAGFEVPEEIDLGKPNYNSEFSELADPADHPDFSAVSRRNADPFAFSNNE